MGRFAIIRGLGRFAAKKGKKAKNLLKPRKSPKPARSPTRTPRRSPQPKAKATDAPHPLRKGVGYGAAGAGIGGGAFLAGRGVSSALDSFGDAARDHVPKVGEGLGGLFEELTEGLEEGSKNLLLPLAIVVGGVLLFSRSRGKGASK